jgi:hypothetical protein
MIGRCADARSQVDSMAIVKRRTQVRRVKEEDDNLILCTNNSISWLDNRIVCKGRAVPDASCLLRFVPPRFLRRFATSRINTSPLAEL